MFCGGHSEFLMLRGLLVRGLEPKYGNRSESPRSSKKMTRDEPEMIAFQICISSRDIYFVICPKLLCGKKKH